MKLYEALLKLCGFGIFRNFALMDKNADTPRYILGIESSCDDTSAAVLADGILLSNVTASQSVHEAYGGVVPELASRAHQQNIVPVVSEALRQAGIKATDLSAVAYTRGPGLLGSLLVGTSFAKALAIGLDIPLIEVNHLRAHVLSHFIRTESDTPVPGYPFLCLLVSGGNTQLLDVRSPSDMRILGQTIDDAAGEAFDKCAKIMGLPYPGGPHIDRLAAEGNPEAFRFAKPRVEGLDCSFSGLKTSFLYTLRDAVAKDPGFIDTNKTNLAASVQKAIIDILTEKLEKAIDATGAREIAVAGGVSANSGVRAAIEQIAKRRGIKCWIPLPRYTTDNAAMVAMAGYFKYLDKDYSDIAAPPFARTQI